jgi:hypothetical protein
MKTITVGELRSLLDGQDDDMPVIVTADYGDRGRTQMALPLRGEVDTVTIQESAYSTSGYAIEEPEDGDDDYTPYLVIR